MHLRFCYKVDARQAEKLHEGRGGGRTLRQRFTRDRVANAGTITALPFSDILPGLSP